MGSSGGSPGRTTENVNLRTSNTYDPRVIQQGQDLYGRMNNFTQGYQGAPWNPNLAQSEAQALQFGANPAGNYNDAASWLGNDRGGGWSEQAMQRLMGLAGGSGTSFGGGGGTENFDPSRFGQVRDSSWRDFTSFNLNDYMNPYTGAVVDTTLAGIDRGAEQDRIAAASRAARAGSFGGGRQAVMEGVAAGEVANARAAAEAGLRNQAFQTAAGLIQGDQQGGFGASAANQQADLGVRGQNVDAFNADAARRSQSAASAQASQVQALQAILNGGIDLGQLDINRGNAFGGLANDQFDRSSGFGQWQYDANRQAALDPAYLMQMQGGLLSSLPNNTYGTEQGTRSGTQQAQQQGVNWGQVAGSVAMMAMMMSDKRLKENVQTKGDNLAALRGIMPKEFDWKGGERDTGFIAQDVAASDPASAGSINGVGAIKPISLLARSVGAINELDKKVSALGESKKRKKRKG